jgi:hypothetical protein
VNCCLMLSQLPAVGILLLHKRICFEPTIMAPRTCVVDHLESLQRGLPSPIVINSGYKINLKKTVWRVEMKIEINNPVLIFVSDVEWPHLWS